MAHRNILPLFLAWLAVSAGAVLYHIAYDFSVKLLLVRHASYFVFGRALALIVGREALRIRERVVDWGLVFMSALYATYIHTSALPAYTVPNPNDAFIISVLHGSFFLGIPILVYLSGDVTHHRVLQGLTILGGLTYPLYLLHQRIGNMIIDLLAGISPVSWFTLVVCFEVVIIGTAYFVYVYESRLRKRLQGR